MAARTTLEKFDEEVNKSLQSFSRGVLYSLSIGFLAAKITRVRMFFWVGATLSPFVGINQSSNVYITKEFYTTPRIVLEREELRQSMNKIFKITNGFNRGMDQIYKKTVLK